MGEFRFGASKVSKVGCEVISVYNALRYLGKAQPFADVLNAAYPYRWLFGLFGMSPRAVGRLLRFFSCAFSRLTKRADIERGFSAGNLFILCQWNTKTVFGGIHTYMIVKGTDGRLRPLNSGRDTAYESYREMCEKLIETYGGRTICVYSIEP